MTATATKPANRERRYIYSGGAGTQPPHVGYAVPPNRRGRKRRVSTFMLILSLLGAGVVVVFYVHNIISVNRLAGEINRLEATLDSIRNVNATLQAEVDVKSSRERISASAMQQLGLRHPERQPEWLVIDTNRITTVTRR